MALDGSEGQVGWFPVKMKISTVKFTLSKPSYFDKFNKEVSQSQDPLQLPSILGFGFFIKLVNFGNNFMPFEYLYNFNEIYLLILDVLQIASYGECHLSKAFLLDLHVESCCCDIVVSVIFVLGEHADLAFCVNFQQLRSYQDSPLGASHMLSSAVRQTHDHQV